MCYSVLRSPVVVSRAALPLSLQLVLVAASLHAADRPGPESKGLKTVRAMQSEMIWDAAPHNAFTDLARWNGRWYCSFREGAAHSSYDGAVRILSSTDGRRWQSEVRFAEEGLDLRDPKLCILPNGRLLVGVGARRQDQQDPRNWHTTSRVYITSDGEHWDGPHAVGDSQVWMWRYVTHKDHVYSFGYRQRPKDRGGDTFLRFYRSRNGLDWETITETEGGGGYVNEAAFAFEPDGRCVVLLRREGGNNRLGMAQPPYTGWTWSDLDERFNGPALLRMPDGSLLAGGRSKCLGAQAARTALGWLKSDPPTLIPLVLLPSQHETGYPGLCLHDDRVWVSYYSSESGKCAIYIAQLEVADPP